MEYIRKFKKENVRIVYLVITQKCNLKCSFCIRGKEGTECSTLSMENVIRYLNEIRNLNDDITLIITGGEATLHPQFREIMEKSTELFSKVILCSNGTIYERLVDNSDLLRKCRVQISIDGSVDYHNLLRGKDAYQKSRKTIEYLAAQKIDVSVAATVSKDNIASMCEMFDDMYSVGVRAFKLSKEMPGGYAADREDNQLSYREWNDFCDEFRRYTSERTVSISMKKSFPFIAHNLNMNGVSDDMLSKAGCKAGITMLYIYPDRKVYGCPMLEEYPLLDLDRNTLSDLEKKYTECSLYDYSVDSASACNSCKYKEICRSGCPGRRNDIDKLWNGDKTCPIVRGDVF
ncbi:MAG: radical SAM protein [Oscillospiraceae bacterium]|nr:radical SAM protein [Oscillospiraceae bacterium]